MADSAPLPMHIRSVRIRSLFGKNDYEFPRRDSSAAAPIRTLILYGDNGSGKTTILKLVYHTLASAVQAGHRTFMARTKFASIEIELGDGLVVMARKLDDSLLGTFAMSVVGPGRSPVEQVFVAESDNSIPAPRDVDSFQQFTTSLEATKLSLYFLTDARTIMTDTPVSRRRPATEEYEEELRFARHLTTSSRAVRADPEAIARQLAVRSVGLVESQLRRWSLQVATRSESNVTALYREIVRSLLETHDEEPSTRTTRAQLAERLQRLDRATVKFDRFALLPRFDATDFLRYVENCPETRLDVLGRVLEPYLDSLDSRLETLSPLQKRVQSFVDTLNSFYSHKKVTLTTSRGLSVQSADSEDLDPLHLSSGERQLLLLFCTTMMTLETPSVVFIDEPELSLNIKWQRSLLPSLLSFVGDAPVQFVFATHSFEILSQHMDSVYKLEEV